MTQFTNSFSGDPILINEKDIVTIRPFESTHRTPEAHKHSKSVVTVRMQSRHRDYSTNEYYTLDTSPIYVRETVEEIAQWQESQVLQSA